MSCMELPNFWEERASSVLSSYEQEHIQKGWEWRQLSLKFESYLTLDSVLKIECMLVITSTITYRGHDPSPYQIFVATSKMFWMLSKSSSLPVSGNCPVDPVCVTGAFLPLVTCSSGFRDAVLTETKNHFSIIAKKNSAVMLYMLLNRPKIAKVS